MQKGTKSVAKERGMLKIEKKVDKSEPMMMNKKMMAKHDKMEPKKMEKKEKSMTRKMLPKSKKGC